MRSEEERDCNKHMLHPPYWTHCTEFLFSFIVFIILIVFLFLPFYTNVWLTVDWCSVYLLTKGK